MKDKIVYISNKIPDAFPKEFTDVYKGAVIKSCIFNLHSTYGAFLAYQQGEYGKTFGSQYLALVGFFQLLIIQQDAVFDLCNILNIKDISEKFNKRKENFPSLQEVRDVRNKAFGHPTNHTYNKQYDFNYIMKHPFYMEDVNQGFQLVTAYKNGVCYINHIVPRYYRNIQFKEIEIVLDVIIQVIDKRLSEIKTKQTEET